jgi:hypothetical protein
MYEGASVLVSNQGSLDLRDPSQENDHAALGMKFGAISPQRR